MTVVIDGVEKTYGAFALGPLDITVGDEVLAVLGPSGCGKTTLLSTVAGIVDSDAGDVAIDGRSLAGLPPERRQAGLVFQDGALFPHMTARENVAYAATADALIDELAEVLEIGGLLDRRPAALSGGERQRVALARTLAADPDVLLLDEPLSSLDAPIRRRLRDELHDLFSTLDIPVIYVTHDQRSATVLGDRIAVLRDGSVEQIGTPSTILERPATEFVARFTGSENVFEGTVTTRSDGDGTALGVGDVAFPVRTDRDHGNTVTACVRPSRIQLGASTGPAAVFGTVRRRLNEGDRYRLVVALDAADIDLVAWGQPSDERPVPDVGSTVELSIPPDAIHLL
jgi:molybdate/tungstate transport system ATP-binding protein